jgi:hypothetical protein
MQKQSKQNKKDAKRNAKAPSAKKLARAEQTVENHFRLGMCAQMYAESLANPFSGPPGACMPVTPCVQSAKRRFFIRTQAVVGTNGVGFVTQGFNAANDGATTAGNVGTACLYSSGSGYAQAATVALPVLDPATAGVIGSNHNGDYPLASFTAGSAGVVQQRLVSMGIRVRYAGTKLNQGGRVITWEDPEHNTINGATALTLANLLAYERAKERPVTMDKWIQVCSSGPVTPEEYDFSKSFSFNSSTNKAFPLLLFLQSTAGNVFDVEAYWNYELTGTPVRGKTYSESDDQGVSVVLGAIKSVNDSALDSGHPLVISGEKRPKGSENTPHPQLTALVNQYARKNTSGWVVQTAKKIGGFIKSAEPYVKAGIRVAEELAPMAMMAM